ncbi:MAG: chloride channel protein [Planctomycetaceae bacterium]
MNLLSRLRAFLQGFELRSTGKWFLLSTVVGVVAGLGAIGFQNLGQAVAQGLLVPATGFSPGEAAGEHHFLSVAPGEFRPWLIVAVMIVGGLLSGWLVYTFAPEAEGHGTDAAIEAFHQNRGRIRARIPIIKTIASAITLGTGGSGGREGPIAQIGAGFGSYLATRLGLSARDRRIMLAAGMGAGVGAIFRAPLAGALFAAEILYRDADLESDVIVPSAISSIVGYTVYSLSLPADNRFVPLFGNPPDIAPTSPLELLPFAALSLVLVLVSVLYIKVFYGTHGLFKKLPMKPHWRPAIGAGFAGLAALGLYFGMGEDRETLAVLSTGYGSLQAALTNGLGIKLLLAIAFVKILTTSLTISSGGSGGVFGPSMVIGGCVGSSVGQWFHEKWPQLVPQPQVYAIVGMAGFFAGCAHAPISTIIMVSEMTGSYNLLLPTMWVSTLCFLLCRRWTLYDKQVPTRVDSPAHRGDFIVDILEGIEVADVYRTDRKIIFIPEGTSLDDILHLIAKTQQHYFPVTDDDGRMIGIFSTDDVRSYLYDETIWHLAVARDIMVADIVSVTPDDDLNIALQRFTSLNLDELPVIDPDDRGKLLGMLRRKETIAAYNRRLREHKQEAAETL